MDMCDWLFVCALLIGYGLGGWHGIATAALAVIGYIAYSRQRQSSFLEKADEIAKKTKNDIDEYWNKRERDFLTMRKNAEVTSGREL